MVGHGNAPGPVRTFATLRSAAAQLHQTGHSLRALNLEVLELALCGLDLPDLRRGRSASAAISKTSKTKGRKQTFAELCPNGSNGKITGLAFGAGLGLWRIETIQGASESLAWRNNGIFIATRHMHDSTKRDRRPIFGCDCDPKWVFWGDCSSHWGNCPSIDFVAGHDNPRIITSCAHNEVSKFNLCLPVIVVQENRKERVGLQEVGCTYRNHHLLGRITLCRPS